jgi:hypothetical protein
MIDLKYEERGWLKTSVVVAAGPLRATCGSPSSPLSGLPNRLQERFPRSQILGAQGPRELALRL